MRDKHVSYAMHAPYVPIQDNGFGECPVMSKLRIARITSAQGGGTSRRNARQVDPNIIPLAYHSPLCWHGLPKHRFRAEMQWNLFFREMHRCHGRALHALKDINQCRRIPVLCGPGQHPQLFYKSNELKPSIPLKFVLPWSNCDMVFEDLQKLQIQTTRRSLFEFHVPRGQFTLSMAGFDIGRAAMFWKSSTMVPGGYLQFCLTPMLLHEWTEPTFWLGCCHSLWIVENTFYCETWMSRK